MQDAIYHCHDIAYPLQFDTFDRHSCPLMPWYHPACYHCIRSMQEGSTSIESSVRQLQSSLWNVQQRDNFSCLVLWLGFMNIVPAEWIVKRSPGSSGSKGTVMDVKRRKDIVGQSVGLHHRSLMRSR